jgi:hypothetical protein
MKLSHISSAAVVEEGTQHACMLVVSPTLSVWVSRKSGESCEADRSRGGGLGGLGDCLLAHEGTGERRALLLSVDSLRIDRGCVPLSMWCIGAGALGFGTI